MKRSLCNDFCIDGVSMPTPDAEVSLVVADLEGDSGTDESGFYHRHITRSGVRKWAFSFAVLTAEEYSYLENLFIGKATFKFTFPDADGVPHKVTAYRTGTSVCYYSSRLGLYKNMSFTINEC